MQSIDVLLEYKNLIALFSVFFVIIGGFMGFAYKIFANLHEKVNELAAQEQKLGDFITLKAYFDEELKKHENTIYRQLETLDEKLQRHHDYALKITDIKTKEQSKYINEKFDSKFDTLNGKMNDTRYEIDYKINNLTDTLNTKLDRYFGMMMENTVAKTTDKDEAPRRRITDKIPRRRSTDK